MTVKMVSLSRSNDCSLSKIMTTIHKFKTIRDTQRIEISSKNHTGLLNAMPTNTNRLSPNITSQTWLSMLNLSSTISEKVLLASALKKLTMIDYPFSNFCITI